MTRHSRLVAAASSSFLISAVALAAATAPAAETARPALAITHVRLFDGTRVLPDATVVIEGRTIAAVGVATEVPPGAEVIDGRGATLLPGFIDAHTHTWGDALTRAAVFGVTTELDMFTLPSFAAAMRAEQTQSGAPGRADLFSAGYLATVPGGHGTEYGMPVPTLSKPDEAQAWVDARLAEGSDYIKIISEDGSAYGRPIPTLGRATIAAIIAAAHRRGKLAVVHVSTADRAEQAIVDGIDGLMHIFDDRAATPELVALTARRKAFVVPTLTVVESITGKASGESLVDDLRLSPFLTEPEVESLRRSFPPHGSPHYEHALEAVRLLAAAGVPILAGTDAPNPGTTHGASIHRELELLVRAGLSPVQALSAATSAPAKAFGLVDRGRIAPGLRADLVLVNGDPTRDITATRDIRRVWKLGQQVSRPLAPPRSTSAAKPVASLVPDSGLLADFDGAATGGSAEPWRPSTDQLAGGKSEAQLEIVAGGVDGSARSLAIRGELRAGFAYPWAGAMLVLAAQSPGAFDMPAVDLSRFRAISFAVRGEGASFQLLVFAKRLGRIPASKSFTAGDEWQRIVVPLSELGLDGSDLQAVFLGGGVTGPFRLQVDDVRLLPKEP